MELIGRSLPADDILEYGVTANITAFHMGLSDVLCRAR